MKGSGSHLSPYSWDKDHVQLEASGGGKLSYVDTPEEETKGALLCMHTAWAQSQ